MAYAGGASKLAYGVMIVVIGSLAVGQLQIGKKIEKIKITKI